MQKFTFFVVLALAITVVCAQERVFLEGEEPSDVPRAWNFLEEAAADSAPVRLTVMLKLRNADQLSEIFEAVSDPRSPRFSQHLTMDELVELVAPEQEAVETVLFWLREHGIVEHRMPLTRDLVTFVTDVRTAEKLLACSFHQFEHLESGRRAISSFGGYSVPAHIARYVNVVAGVTGFPIVKAATFESADEAGLENPLIKPGDLRSSYGVPATLVGTNSTNSQAVAEFQGQFYSPSDLTEFFATNVPYSDASTVAGVIGQNVPARPGVEASLDIQWIMGIAPSVPTYFYSDASFNFWSDITAWITDLLSEAKPKWVHSVSYGDQSLSGQPSVQYKQSTDQQFQKAGALGMSIIFASGDSGAGCSLCTRLSPSYPATSPYVTSVGATRFTDGVGSQEGAVESFGSGGGFDWELPVADYQKTAVNTFLADNKAALPPASDFNAGGRATPDVSALGIGFSIVVGGRAGSVGGTSASTPTFSAIISLINDARLNNQKRSLGFLNNWIYQNADMFTDIVLGNNKHSCCRGFQAAKGYDPVTGLGTPIFSKMLSSALSLP